MKRTTGIVAMLALMCLLAPAEDIKKLKLDDLNAVGTKIQSDTEDKVDAGQKGQAIY